MGIKNQFVQGVSNFKRFRNGIEAVKNRGAMEASMMLLTSQAGYGKTITLDHWATQEEAIHLRAKVEWTPHYFMREMAFGLGVAESGRAKDLFTEVVKALGRHGGPVVIDEVNHCMARGAAVLEAIRDLSDMTEVIVVLAGHEDVQPRIARYPQIRSRIAQVVEFLPATPGDIRVMADTLLDVRVADDLVSEIHKQSAGRMREIKNALKRVDAIGETNRLKTVALKDIGGQRLVFDWQLKRGTVRSAATA